MREWLYADGAALSVMLLYRPIKPFAPPLNHLSGVIKTISVLTPVPVPKVSSWAGASERPKFGATRPSDIAWRRPHSMAHGWMEALLLQKIGGATSAITTEWKKK